MNAFFSVRLLPGQDLKSEIQNFCIFNNIKAGCILSGVGSLTSACLRLAGSEITLETSGKFEIVSITGTVSQNGSHLHIAVADHTGSVIGGHLLNGNTIFTTCEIVILNLPEQEFKREFDDSTGFNELKTYLIKS